MNTISREEMWQHRQRELVLEIEQLRNELEKLHAENEHLRDFIPRFTTNIIELSLEKKSMNNASVIECDGGPYCQAAKHIEGCFAMTSHIADRSRAGPAMSDIRSEVLRKAEAYDRARSEVKIDGNTRAEYVLQRDAAWAEVERLRKREEHLLHGICDALKMEGLHACPAILRSLLKGSSHEGHER